MKCPMCLSPLRKLLNLSLHESLNRFRRQRSLGDLAGFDKLLNPDLQVIHLRLPASLHPSNELSDAFRIRVTTLAFSERVDVGEMLIDGNGVWECCGSHCPSTMSLTALA